MNRLCLFLVVAFTTSTLLLAEESVEWVVKLPSPDSATVVRGKRVEVVNRAYVFFAETYAQDVDLRLEWQWKDEGGGDAYADHLIVALHSSRNIAKERAYETQDGVRVRIDAGYGKVAIEEVFDGKTHLIKEADLKVKLPPGERHRVVVKDDGRGHLAVYVKTEDEPAVEGDYSDRHLRAHDQDNLGFGNREQVGTNHHSIVEVIKVSQVPK